MLLPTDIDTPLPARPPRAGARSDTAGADVLKKAVNTLAIVPKSARITTLGRKSYNVLLFHAQEQGLERDLFRAPLEAVIRGVDFDSNDHALIKKHLRAMVSTTVEWQSPTTGEGSSWNVSGLLAHARLYKERGQVWIEWSYAVNLKQELLQPTVFARLRLEIISQLRSHAGVALYEICTRYKDIGRTARQAWRWWQPVLSGNPPSEKTAKLEYRIFKRDTLKPAIAEVNALTDIEVELVEHRQGRFVDELQFRIQPRRAAAAPGPRPVDVELVARATRLGVDEDAAEQLLERHGDAAFGPALDALAQRVANAWPEPLRNPTRYLRALLPGVPAAASDADAPPPAPRARTRATGRAIAEQRPAPEAAASGLHASGRPPADRPSDGAAAPPSAAASAPTPLVDDPALRQAQARRQARWTAEWLRRRRERLLAELDALHAERLAELAAALAEDLERRAVHPTLRKRLATSGWRHPLVQGEMLRFYATGAHGEHWDRPPPHELLAIAAELGADEG